uniref:Rapid alkalinization factor 1 n=1 Tax=Oryza punctata TaxID=4537 RepID=A0A0E0JIB9_ORYPU
MARAATVPAAAAVCALLLLSLAAGAGEAPLRRWEWELGISGNDGNDGMGSSEEAAADSAAAVVRRVLQGKDNMISYGSLQRGTTPCSVRGASYYNCRPGAQANPYSRGCSAITRCRG